MATTKKDIVKVTKTIEVEEPRYILELTEAEARTLLLLTGKINGCPRTTIRKYTSDVWTSLSCVLDPDSFSTCHERFAVLDTYIEFSRKSLEIVERK